jgi:phytoene desaturase
VSGGRGHGGTVRGRTDRVVVVGAGLAGLSAALHLAGAGREVTLLEQSDRVGGRAGQLEVETPSGTYRLDTGPTVLTVPELLDDAFAAVGEERADRLPLDPVDPAYQARFADGSHLDVRTDVPAMAQAISELCGPDEAAGYLRFVDHVAELYRLEMRHFIDHNMDSPVSLLAGPGAARSMARLVAMGGLRKLAPAVGSFLKDDRTRRLFSFQSLYAGVAPQKALALYAVIAYMDTVAGVWFPRGGVHAVPTAMADAARAHGVTIRLGAEVEVVERTGGRATAVVTTDGERVPLDVLVLTADLPVARRDLLDDPLRRTPRLSPSCWLLLAGGTGSPAGPDGLRHHTISFGSAWDQTFDELVGGRLMSDPSLLVSVPSSSDPGLAPEGRHAYSVLAPTPHLAHRDPLDWAQVEPAYREHVLGTLRDRGHVDIGTGLEVDHVTTPQGWLERGMEGGTPFALAHTFGQTGPFRPSNRWGDNVVLAGSGTTPGVGVPMVLISGRLAAERVTGPDPSYRSRAWP